MTTENEPEPVEELPTVTPPSAPAGTKHDGDPLFEALVYGWACAADGWNGQSRDVLASKARSELAGYFEQFLDQQDGHELREKVATEHFGRGELVWLGESGPVVLSSEPSGPKTADLLELTDKREQIIIASLLRWALRRIGVDL